MWIGNAGRVETVGAGLGVGSESFERDGESIGVAHEPRLATSGKDHRNPRCVNGLARGFDPFDCKLYIVERRRVVSRRIFDRQSGNSRGYATRDVFGDGFRLVCITVLEIGIDWQPTRLNNVARMREHVVDNHRLRRIGKSTTESKARRSRREGFETEMFEIDGCSPVPRIWQYKTTGRMQRLETFNNRFTHMKKIPLLATIILITAGHVLAQTAPDAAELTRLLNEFLAGASRNDAAIHDRFWADDLIYTRSPGRRVTKADVMHDVRNAPAPKPNDPKTIYTAEDIRIQQYGDTAIVAFRLVATTETAGTKHVANLLNSGTFVKRNGKWQVVNWQSTRMPRSDEETRAEVAAAVNVLYQSLVSADASKLSSVMDPGFIWTRHDGLYIDQARLIKELASGLLKFKKPDDNRQMITIKGDTAIVRGEFEPAKEFYTLTLVNQVSGWKAVAMHTNRR
jgi:ketosteroid isomerase-like protein